MNDGTEYTRRVALRSIAAVSASLGLAPLAEADEPKSDRQTPRPADVESIDSIIAALYDVISGDKGVARDWDRFRSLFAPGARLIPCTPKDAKGIVGIRPLSPDEFAKLAAAATAKRGFHEKEIARKLDRFGHIAHVFSTYASSETKSSEPFDKGINSIQLHWDNVRWWVVTIFWDVESKDQPIPTEYRSK